MISNWNQPAQEPQIPHVCQSNSILETRREIKLSPSPFGSVKFNPFQTLCVLERTHCLCDCCKANNTLSSPLDLCGCWRSSHCMYVREKENRVRRVLICKRQLLHFFNHIVPGAHNSKSLCVVVELETMQASDNAINLHLRVCIAAHGPYLLRVITDSSRTIRARERERGA